MTSAESAEMQALERFDNWQLGDPYERYVGRWSRRVAPAFLSWLDVPRGKRWLDLGCGTGALSAAILERYAPASLIGVDPSAGFLKVARETLSSQADLRTGDATSIPLPDASVEVIASGLVLNFVPDLNVAFKEIARVAATGSTFGAYVWDYAEGMQLMRHFWDAAVALNPQAAELGEGRRFPLCHPDALREQVCRAGFHDAEVTAIDVPTLFANFLDYWEPFLGGQGSAPGYVMSLTDVARRNLRDRLEHQLPIQGDGSISLTARAWAVRATV